MPAGADGDERQGPPAPKAVESKVKARGPRRQRKADDGAVFAEKASEKGIAPAVGKKYAAGNEPVCTLWPPLPTGGQAGLSVHQMPGMKHEDGSKARKTETFRDIGHDVGTPGGIPVIFKERTAYVFRQRTCALLENDRDAAAGVPPTSGGQLRPRNVSVFYGPSSHPPCS